MSALGLEAWHAVMPSYAVPFLHNIFVAPALSVPGQFALFSPSQPCSLVIYGL